MKRCCRNCSYCTKYYAGSSEFRVDCCSNPEFNELYHDDVTGETYRKDIECSKALATFCPDNVLFRPKMILKDKIIYSLVNSNNIKSNIIFGIMMILIIISVVLIENIQ